MTLKKALILLLAAAMLLGCGCTIVKKTRTDGTGDLRPGYACADERADAHGAAFADADCGAYAAAHAGSNAGTDACGIRGISPRPLFLRRSGV